MLGFTCVRSVVLGTRHDTELENVHRHQTDRVLTQCTFFALLRGHTERPHPQKSDFIHFIYVDMCIYTYTIYIYIYIHIYIYTYVFKWRVNKLGLGRVRQVVALDTSS